MHMYKAAIDSLRQAQYEAAGQKINVVETQARGGSTAMWIGLGVAALALIATVVLGVAGIVITLLLTAP